MGVIIPLEKIRADRDFITFRTPDGPEGLQVINFINNKCGPSVLCDFKKIRKPRSTGEGSQSHHLNGHITQICRELGMWSPSEFEQVKTEVKRIAHIAFGYPGKEIKPGVWIFKSEADCDTLECSWLIEAVHLLAGELNISLIEAY